MAVRRFLFEVAPSGSTLTGNASFTAGNVVSDDGAFGYVAPGTGASITSDSAWSFPAGGLSAKFATTGGGPATVRLRFAAAHTVGAVDVTRRRTAAVAAARVFLTARHSGGVIFRVVENTNGSFALQTNAGTQVGSATSAGLIPASGGVRYEITYTLASGANSDITVKAYDEAGTLLGTSAHTGVDLGAASYSAVAVDVGSPVSGTADTVWVDTVQLQDGSDTPIGPYTDAAPPAAAVDEVAGYVVDATGSTPGAGGDLTYGITQTSGTPTPVIQVTDGLWVIPQGSTATVWTVTVTESGTLDTDTIDVTVPAASGGNPDSLAWNPTTAAWM